MLIWHVYPVISDKNKSSPPWKNAKWWGANPIAIFALFSLAAGLFSLTVTLDDSVRSIFEYLQNFVIKDIIKDVDEETNFNLFRDRFLIIMKNIYLFFIIC